MLIDDRRTMLSRLPMFVLGVLLATADSLPAMAEELRLEPAALFSRSTTENLELAADGASIQLSSGRLYEDDGPAAGYSFRPNQDRLGPDVRIRKELIIPDPRARQATLLVGSTGELEFQINGQSAELQPLGRQGNYWQAWTFPPGVLKAGSNSFVISGSGAIGIARDDEFAAGSLTRRAHPNRSARSADGGKTWSDTKLGPKGDIDGEYYVRVFLDQAAEEGTLTLDVLDVGNLSGEPIGPPLQAVGPIRIAADLHTPDGSTVLLRCRTGTTAVPNRRQWSDWSDFDGGTAAINQPRGRYLQVSLVYQSSNPVQTPSCKGLTIQASPEFAEDWTESLVVSSDQPQRIVRSSIPFQYEPYDRPELAELRRAENLDDVVKGAETELELVARLARWAATRWNRMHFSDGYPAWNTLEILKPHADGTPLGGFCQQHSIAFLQACAAYGIPGRAISVGPGNLVKQFRSGHETTEVWSNQFGKWVHVDSDAGWYFVDEKSGTPLSTLEMRNRQLDLLDGKKPEPFRLVELTEAAEKARGLTTWPPLMEVRLIPRSNFLQSQAPLPLNQGLRGWFWTGHHVWTDDRLPPRKLYGHRVTRRENFEWSLNESVLTLEAVRPGVVRVHVDTQTPHLSHLLRTVDGGTAEKTPAVFEWKLHQGENRLQVVSENTAGRRGIATEWTVKGLGG